MDEAKRTHGGFYGKGFGNADLLATVAGGA
jgi:hypothetical protein